MKPTTADIDMWVRRVSVLHPAEAAQYTPEALERSMAGWLDLLAPLELHDHQDQVRFLGLSVLLTPDQRRSRLVQGVLQRIMYNADWSPKQKLDFVYKHLVGRPVSESEEDFGPAFVPIGI
jgi:hypothetical protein